MTIMAKTLRLILGDQLKRQAYLVRCTKQRYHLPTNELHQETDYVSHHIQKIVGFFAAMRFFAKGL